jgi:redox-sensing transcriptional repressor
MIFDSDPAKAGTQVENFIVEAADNLGEKIRENDIKIVMIAVPAAEAQKVADQLVQAGVQAILNYAPVNLTVPQDVHVQYIDPATHLQRMTYYLA